MNEFIEVDITSEMIDIAKNHCYEVAEKKQYDKHSIRRGSGTLVGSLGEVIVHSVFPEWEWSNTFDYDFLLEGYKIDIKSKDRTVPPKPHYEASISNYNPNQDCDFYIFISILRNKNTNCYNKGYIIGGYSKANYYEDCRFIKKGEIDPDNGWKAKCDCYNMPYSMLNSLKEFT